MSKEGAASVREAETDGFVAFLGAGERAAGDFRCSECGYGVSIHRALPRCPMCGGASWESSPSPYARAR